jgi:hypothetical protein
MLPETIKCPECGKPAERYDAPVRAGYQCTNPECMTDVEDAEDVC